MPMYPSGPSGSSYGGGGGGGITYPGGSSGGGGTKKRKKDWRDEIIRGSVGIPSSLLQNSPWGFTQGLGNVFGALGTSPLQALLYPKATGRGLLSSLTGVVEGPYGFGKTVREEGWGDTASLFLNSMKQDFKDRYGGDWEEHAHENGLFNLFDALTFIGAGARGATMVGAAGRLGKAGESITMKNLWKESSRPGLLTGGERDRVLRYQPETGEELTSVQPWSRSPTRRGTQALSDILAEKFPNTPIFGAASRVTRAQGSQLRRVMERTLGGGVIGEEALNSHKLGEAGRTRLFWEAQLGTDDDGALIRLRDALEKEYDNPDAPDTDKEFGQILREAKQAGFGKGVLLKRLDAAIDYDPAKSGGRYEAARDALRQATVLSENTIADASGFTSLRQDLKRLSDRIDGLDSGTEEWTTAVQERVRLRKELAEKEESLRSMFRNRRSILRDWMDTKGENQYADAWHAALTEILGEDQADHAVAVAHAMANKIRPDDPESWWADKVGMPAREGAAAFRERVGDDALFQFGDEAGLLDSGFYSPAQKWTVENFHDPMPQEELRAKLLEVTPKEEFYNSGLDMYFDALPEGAVIHPQEFKLLLANRVNAYNLRQVILNNTADSAAEGLDVRYGPKGRGEGTYISREPGEGEYFEVRFELPGKGRDGPFMDKNKHWGQENVAVHFRFHIFEEDGVRKLLVEEIQSDWANEARVQAREGRVYRNPTAREQEAISDLEREIEELTAHSEELKGRQSVLDEAIRGGDTSSEARREWQEVTAEITALDQDWWELNQGFQFYNEEFGLGNIPPPPLSGSSGSAMSSYLNSPTRWIARAAVEADVDEVILIGREQQLLRNAKAVDPGTWLRLKDEGSEAITAYLRENPPDNSSYVSYDKDIPKVWKREFGGAGQKVDNAYTGEYRVPHNTDTAAKGPMPGTVFKVDKAFRENALRPKSMYQRTPDWNALPKGAVELFDGGKSRIHIFDDGDVSTWIHELGHVALHDLSDADRGVIEAHFGAGKAVAEWTELEHESFARAFEQYVRDGRAPTRALEPIFARLSSWIRAVWEREKRVNPDLPPEVKQVFSTLFRSETEPDIFIPHRAALPDLGGGRTSRGIPRAQREIGDRTLSRIPIFAKNKLGLMRGGMLNDDPRTLLEHANRVVALARANQLREAVLNMGEPLLPGDYPNFETQYVVKRAGRGVDKPTFDALESADAPEEIRSTIKEYIDGHITDDKNLYEEWVGESQLYVVDKKTVDMLFKYVTGKAPGAATKPVTNTSKVMDAVLDSFRGLLLYGNPGFYATNIIGNFAMMFLKDPAATRYLGWSMNNARKAAIRPETADHLWHRISVEMGRGPTTGAFSLQATRDVLTGRPGSQGNKVGKGAEVWSGALGEWGRRSGRVIDDSFRVAAWRQSASKMGYRTDKQVEDLLNDASIQRPFKGKTTHAETKAEKDLNKIRDEAEQLMLDFDSMSPWERTYLQRIIFLYPFLKASSKYPFMFAGERPITAGALAEFGGQGEKFAQQEEVLGPRPELPAWLAGYARGPGGFFNVGSFSPFNQPQQLLESIMALRGGKKEPGVQTPWDYANPVYQLVFDLLRQQNEYGREAPVEEILRTELPLPAWMAYPMRKPSDRWGERDFWNTLLRNMRAAPVQINEGE